MVQCIGVFANTSERFSYGIIAVIFRITNAKNSALIESKTRSLFYGTKPSKLTISIFYRAYLTDFTSPLSHAIDRQSRGFRSQ